MTPARPLPLRIYRADASVADPHALAARELFRPAPAGPGPRDLEPFSRGWFEELEFARYAGRGAWLRRVLEFSRHPGEAVLVLGPGVGSDALQYHRHGAHVTVCTTPADPPDVARTNFDLRGYPVRVVPAGPAGHLPFGPGVFDLACLNALDAPPADFHQAVAEVYRVLRPGGKVFALVPARYDARFWGRLLAPWRRPARRAEATPVYSRRQVCEVFGRFADHRVGQRHVRRSELPYACRVLPPGLVERVAGRVLALTAFKPIMADIAATGRAA